MTYGHFIRDLLEFGLVELIPLRRAYAGCFFVHKKDGRMRLILDNCAANAFLFREPPHTALPSAASWSSQSLRQGEEACFAGGDIKCAFCRMQVPPVAQEFMTLPFMRAKFLASPVSVDEHTSEVGVSNGDELHQAEFENVSN